MPRRGVVTIRHVVYFAAMGLALLSCNSREEQGRPSGEPSGRHWLEAFNIFVYGKPSIEYLEEVRATAVVWSVYYSGYNEEEHAYVRQLRHHGIRVASNYPTMVGSTLLVQDPELLYEASCRDIYGNPARSLWIQPDPPYLMCHNSRAWHAFLHRRIEEHVDGEADAVHVDEPTGMAEHLYLYGFCDPCVSGFRSYLEARFDAEYLNEHFGIEEIRTFHYRDYLVGHHALAVWGDPNPELRREFVRFQLVSRKEQIASIEEHIRHYSKGSVPLSANVSFLGPNKHPLMSTLDLLVFENVVLDSDKRGKHFGIYLLGNAIRPEAPIVMFPDILSLALLSEEDWRLVRHWLAESAAAGGAFLIPHQAYTFGGGTFHVPAEKLSPYTAFLSSYGDAYTGAVRIARVAVLYDYSSALYDYLDLGFLVPWYPAGPTHDGFLGTCLALQESHIPFEVIYTGDGELVDRPLQPADLVPYPITVIPESKRLTKKARAVLGEYELQGGRILWLEDLPRRYWQKYPNRELRDQIADAVRAEDIDLSLETKAPDTVGMIYCQWKGAPLLHLVNYHYDDVLHRFVDVEDIVVSLTLLDGMNLQGKALWLRSPDTEDEQVGYTLDGDRLTFTLPILKGYAVVMFEPE